MWLFIKLVKTCHKTCCKLFIVKRCCKIFFSAVFLRTDYHENMVAHPSKSPVEQVELPQDVRSNGSKLSLSRELKTDSSKNGSGINDIAHLLVKIIFFITKNGSSFVASKANSFNFLQELFFCFFHSFRFLER